MVPVIVLQTVAANLGSMVTPIGNPQNLYLYASGKLDALAFPALTWPYAALAFVLLLGNVVLDDLSCDKKIKNAKGSAAKCCSTPLLCANIYILRM